jgi:hypothetical protein
MLAVYIMLSVTSASNLHRTSTVQARLLLLIPLDDHADHRNCSKVAPTAEMYCTAFERLSQQCSIEFVHMLRAGARCATSTSCAACC